MADRYGAKLTGRIDPDPNPFTSVPPVSGTESYLGTHIALRTLPADIFAPGTTFIPIVDVLPTLPDSVYPQGTVVFLTTDNKLYRSTGSIWTTIVDAVDLAVDSVTTNAIVAGAVTAAKITVSQLSAISADVGILTAGKIQNAGNTSGINLGGAGGIPGTWISGINFEAAAGSGSMTRYINFTATGSNPFVKHELISLNADGSASFGGRLVLNNAAVVATTSPYHDISAQVTTASAGTAFTHLRAVLAVEDGAGSFSDVVNVELGPVTSHNENVTNFYQLRVHDASTIGGTWANVYGVYINSISGGATTNNALFTNLGLVHFGDRVEVVGNAGLGITATADNTADIGQSGTNRFRDLYMSGIGIFGTDPGGTAKIRVDGDISMSTSDVRSIIWRDPGGDTYIRSVSGDGMTFHLKDGTEVIITPAALFGTIDLGSSSSKWATLWLTGDANIKGLTYTWPAAHGAGNRVLQNNGSGTLSWVTGGGGTTGVVWTPFTQDLGTSNSSGHFDITGLSGLTPDQIVDVIQTALPIASKGDSRDEFEMDAIQLTGYVVDASTIRVYWWAPSVVVGEYELAYAVGV